MKRLFFILLVSSVLLNCQHQTAPETETIIKEKVDKLLNNWHQAATDAHFKDYFSTLNVASVFIGTDATENWTKKQFEAFSKPYFDKGKAWDFKTLERNIYIGKHKEIVWFDELLSTWMGTCRGSGVLEKTDTTWTLKHYVLSVPIPNEDIQAVIAAKKKNDSIFLAQFKP